MKQNPGSKVIQTDLPYLLLPSDQTFPDTNEYHLIPNPAFLPSPDKKQTGSPSAHERCLLELYFNTGSS